MPVKEEIEKTILLLNDGDNMQRKSAAMKLGRIRDKASRNNDYC